MTPNEQTITDFYTALESNNDKVICKYYHRDIVFRDPVFGRLIGSDVCQMWKMLMYRNNGNLKVELLEVKANNYNGKAIWKASYHFGKNNNKVENIIQSEFRFKDGLIIKHTDDFDIWKWSKQALGIPGVLLGWTGYMHKKIQEKALLALKKFKVKDS